MTHPMHSRVEAAISRVKFAHAAAEVLEDIERTHAMIPKEELLHTYTVLMAAGKTREAARLQSIWTKEPIRHGAAESDTPETTAER